MALFQEGILSIFDTNLERAIFLTYALLAFLILGLKTARFRTVFPGSLNDFSNDLNGFGKLSRQSGQTIRINVRM